MKKIFNKWYWAIIGLFFLGISMLFLLRGENSIISVHDNLDLFIPQYKLLKDEGAFFGGQDLIPFLGGINRYLLPSEWNLYTLLYVVLPPYYAYIVGYLLKVLIAIVGTNLLVKDILKDDYDKYVSISMLCGLAYGILNLFPNFGICFSSIPLFVFIIRRIIAKPNILWYSALLIYPMLSYFSYFGFFLIGYLFVYFIYRWIKTRRFPLRLLLAVAVLSVGYVLCEYRLFITMLFPVSDTIRSTMVIESLGFGDILKEIFGAFLYGDMHSEAMQLYFALPVCGLFLIYQTFAYVKAGNLKKIFRDPFYGVILFILFNSIVYGLYYSEGVRKVFETILPPLSGFQFNRTIFFNPFLWYVALFIVAKRVYDLLPKFKPFAGLILIGAMIVTVLSNTRYNDIYHTCYDIAKETLSGTRSNELSYGEFFSEDLFNDIKEDINYDGEWCAAYGFYPAVLQYNGFHTLDGYLGYYSQFYKEEFRKIIAPALDQRPESAAYYDNWGARCNLYSGTNSSITNAYRNYEYTDEDIYIDLNAFKDIAGRYIFSRVKINNADEVGLTLINTYESEDSPYIVYLYRTTSIFLDKEKSDIPYELRDIPTPDYDRIMEIADELEAMVDEINDAANDSDLSDKELVEQFGREDELLALYDEGNSILDDCTTAYSMYNIKSFQDYTDNEASDMMSRINSQLIDVNNAINMAVQKICQSPYEVTMHKRLRSAVIDSLKEYEETSDEEKDLILKEESLQNEYFTIMAEELDNGLDEEHAKVVGEIYLELLDVCDQIAELNDYDNYADYAYAEVYGKDYTLEDVKSLCAEIKDKCSRYLGKTEELAENFRLPEDFEISYGRGTFEQLKPYMGEISPELENSLQYLLDNNLFDMAPSDIKEENGFTIPFDKYGDAFIFDSPYGTYSDIFTHVHEFGHFNHMLNTYEDDYEDFNNIDLSEYNSQGLEVLFSRYYPDIYGEEVGGFLAYQEIEGFLYTIVQSCMITEFEIYAHEHPDCTVEELGRQFFKLEKEYGFVPEEGVDEAYTWTGVWHLFQSPFYYISYGTSALLALETYEQADENFDAAVEKYLQLSAIKSNWGFKNTFEFFGMEDIFEPGVARKIFKSTYKQLKELTKE